MELSPKERRRIYEEEKARIETEEKLEGKREEAEGVSTTNLAPNVAGLLCYLGVWISGIIFLILEQKNRFVRFHAIQSIVVFGVLSIANAIVSQIPIVGWFFGVIMSILTFILWIVLMVKAYQGELYKVPVTGDLAERTSGVAYEKSGETVETGKAEAYAKPPTPPVPPEVQPQVDSGRQVSGRTEEHFRTTRAGRITASSFAIAWSFVFLILFNFFSKYITYYQYEASQWVRYPILTADFNAWLPIINAALIFSILGHILVILIDRYLLRETTIIILNLFGLAAVLSLLSIFPFDFGAIPNEIAADILPVIVTVALIGIAIGLGIAALVGFIKLIVSTVTRTAHY